jgi:hypothetical protein
MCECEHTVARRGCIRLKTDSGGGAGKRLGRVSRSAAGGWKRGRLACGRKNRSMKAQIVNP